jgi:hypothetical protein
LIPNPLIRNPSRMLKKILDESSKPSPTSW